MNENENVQNNNNEILNDISADNLDNNNDSISIKSIAEQDQQTIIEKIETSNSTKSIITSNNAQIILHPQSVKKIFYMMKENDENIGDVYAYNIMFKIEEILDTSNHNIQENTELELKYQKLLENTSFFHISIDNNYYIDQNNFASNKDILTNKRIIINKKALNNIFKFLNKNIFEMSDYIRIVVLFLSKQSQSNIAKLIIKNKILGKYQKTPEYIKVEEFKGIGKVKYNFDVPKKNKNQNLYKLDMYFNKVLDQLENFDKESSFSDQFYFTNINIPRKCIDEDLLRENLIGDIEFQQNNDHMENSPVVGEEKMRVCDQNFCNGLCKIF